MLEIAYTRGIMMGPIALRTNQSNFLTLWCLHSVQTELMQSIRKHTYFRGEGALR